VTRPPSNQIIAEIPAGAGHDSVADAIMRVFTPLTVEQRTRVAAMLSIRFGMARRKRKASIATLVKRAEKSGRTVSSVVTPDGMTINFNDPEPSKTNNPWLADIAKGTKQ
jgi:hypothetical protein